MIPTVNLLASGKSVAMKSTPLSLKANKKLALRDNLSSLAITKVAPVKVARQDTQTVVNALIQHAHKLPQELYPSLTWDRGKELATHKRFTLATWFQ
jgi:IS30 family transposase